MSSFVVEQPTATQRAEQQTPSQSLPVYEAQSPVVVECLTATQR